MLVVLIQFTRLLALRPEHEGEHLDEEIGAIREAPVQSPRMSMETVEHRQESPLQAGDPDLIKAGVVRKSRSSPTEYAK